MVLKGTIREFLIIIQHSRLERKLIARSGKRNNAVDVFTSVRDTFLERIVNKLIGNESIEENMEIKNRSAVIVSHRNHKFPLVKPVYLRNSLTLFID